MSKGWNLRWILVTLLAATAVLLALVGCSPTAGSETEAPTAVATEGEDVADEHTDEHAGEHDDEHADEHEDEHAEDHEHDAALEVLALPELDAADLNDQPLRVIATTTIIGDVVAQVGGDAIDLTVLIEPGQDPHSYEPAARELTAVADAHVIFVNGWNLEEGLGDDLATIGGDVPVAPISANIEPLPYGAEAHEHEEEEEAHEEGEMHEEGEAHEEGDDHAHSGADPHVWFSVHNVEQWVENVMHVLSDLDPANAATYEANAADYLTELEALQEYVAAQLSQIPAENRFLVTNHESFGYFAHEYGFTVLGTVIPGASTLAEPSASELAGLIEKMDEFGVCTIFTEMTVSDTLAQTAAAELNNCDDVQVLKLYTGAVGPAGSGADSYVGMFRANVDTIVAGLTGDQ